MSCSPRPPPFPTPMGSTPLFPELPLHPSGRRLRGGCRPPERPRAAWAAGGASCEAAGRGLGCGLLRCRAVSQKCSCPSPHTPLNSHLAPHRTPSHPPLGLNYPLPDTPNPGIWCLGPRRIKRRSCERTKFRPSISAHFQSLPLSPTCPPLPCGPGLEFHRTVKKVITYKNDRRPSP